MQINHHHAIAAGPDRSQRGEQLLHLPVLGAGLGRQGDLLVGEQAVEIVGDIACIGLLVVERFEVAQQRDQFTVESTGLLALERIEHALGRVRTGGLVAVHTRDDDERCACGV